MRVDEGLLVDQSLNVGWLPNSNRMSQTYEEAITLRHALHMSTGLYPVDSFRWNMPRDQDSLLGRGELGERRAESRLVREPARTE